MKINRKNFESICTINLDERLMAEMKYWKRKIIETFVDIKAVYYKRITILYIL